MRRDPSQAGNRARKTCRRSRRGEHAGELGVGSPKVLRVWDRHALWLLGTSPHRGASPRESFFIILILCTCLALQVFTSYLPLLLWNLDGRWQTSCAHALKLQSAVFEPKENQPFMNLVQFPIRCIGLETADLQNYGLLTVLFDSEGFTERTFVNIRGVLRILNERKLSNLSAVLSPVNM